MSRMCEPVKLLLLTPPLVPPNCPYPATMHLTGYLRARGFAVEQRDLSVKVVRDVLCEFGGETTDERLKLLQDPAAPSAAKREASDAIADLAIWIRDHVDSEFELTHYASRACANAPDFGTVERLVRRRGVMDGPLARHLQTAIAETRPTVIGVTCPFPGTLVGAFKIARWVKRHCPEIRMVLGGGFVNTEFRELNDPRPRRYFDDILFDEGYAPMARIFGADGAVPLFVKPDYDGIDMGEYFDIVVTDSQMQMLWRAGRWIGLVMARGCYWHKCAFCDVRLPYIGCVERSDPATIVDAMQELGENFHFVDEAMPPALIRGVCREIIRRKFACRWWGNIRFDRCFTPELAKLMARAGCIAVTGGLECADDRLLALMNKGITLASARAVMTAFRDAGIMVHAYLMYGFPTETEDEAFGSLGFVRDLFRENLVQSACWHRFLLTVHSPVAVAPERFGIVIDKARRCGRGRYGKCVFRRYELPYEEPGAPNWRAIGKVLDLALYNYSTGRGFSKSTDFWRNVMRRGVKVSCKKVGRMRGIQASQVLRNSN